MAGHLNDDTSTAEDFVLTVETLHDCPLAQTVISFAARVAPFAITARHLREKENVMLRIDGL